MNPTASTASCPWPAQVELRHASDRQVVGADGIALDLDIFRDACRARAAGLRQRAIAEAGSSLRARVGNAVRALARAAGYRRAVACHGGFF